MKKRNSYLKKAALAGAVLAFSAGAQATILTSIKPLGFIASSIADGVTDTQVLVPTGASPHDYSLKPSDIKKVKSADLIIWIGEDVDMFLDNAVLRDIDRKKVITVVEISDISDDMLHKGEHHHGHGHEHEHEHEHGHEHHDHEHNHKHEHHDHDHSHNHAETENSAHSAHDHGALSTNWHIWYSPEISQIVAKKIAERLTTQHPEKQALIEKNLEEFNRTLAEGSAKIKQQLAPVHEKGFYVFHDAYTYFNAAYQLNQKGYFTLNPLVAPGAKTLAHIKHEIEENQVACLFAEPQFTPKVIESLHQATGVKVGRLDPMGDEIPLGKQAYVNFLQYTADSYFSCLK